MYVQGQAHALWDKKKQEELLNRMIAQTRKGAKAIFFEPKKKKKNQVYVPL